MNTFATGRSDRLAPSQHCLLLPSDIGLPPYHALDYSTKASLRGYDVLVLARSCRKIICGVSQIAFSGFKVTVCFGGSRDHLQHITLFDKCQGQMSSGFFL